MSLFTSREWWATKLGGDGEEFDQGSLCVANIDNSADGAGVHLRDAWQLEAQCDGC